MCLFFEGHPQILSVVKKTRGAAIEIGPIYKIAQTITHTAKFASDALSLPF